MDKVSINIDFFECPICLEIFKKPRILTCGHSICELCIINIVSSKYFINNNSLYISCPECASLNIFQNIKKMPINYSLLKLINNINVWF